MEEDDLPNIATVDFPEEPPDPGPQLVEVQPAELRTEEMEQGKSNIKSKKYSTIMKLQLQENGNLNHHTFLKKRRRRKEGNRKENIRLQLKIRKHQKKGQGGINSMLLTWLM